MSQRQFLSFMLGNEEYGVDIKHVHEILTWKEITAIPNTPSYVLGVMNLRGSIIPIVDMRRRFCMSEKPADDHTVIMVLNLKGRDKTRIAGLMVDSVRDVYDIDDEQIASPPDFGSGIDTDFISGLATLRKEDQDTENLIILVELSQLLDADMLSRSSDVNANIAPEEELDPTPLAS